MNATSNVTQTVEQWPICGYVLDERGQEHPITEAMIQQACQELEQAQALATQPRPALKQG